MRHVSKNETCTINFVLCHMPQNSTRVDSVLCWVSRFKWDMCRTNLVHCDKWTYQIYTVWHLSKYGLSIIHFAQLIFSVWHIYESILYNMTYVKWGTCTSNFVQDHMCQMGYVHNQFCTLWNVSNGTRMKPILYRMTGMKWETCTFRFVNHDMCLVGILYNQSCTLWTASKWTRTS